MNSIIRWYDSHQTWFIIKLMLDVHDNFFGVRGKDVPGAYRAQPWTTFILLWYDPMIRYHSLNIKVVQSCALYAPNTSLQVPKV